MVLYVKNMVCDRCILVVQQELEKREIPVASIKLGEVNLATEPSERQLADLKLRFGELGFEILDDARKKIIEKIKNIVIEHIHYTDPDNVHNFSEILSQKIYKDYSYLSGLFSEVEGITIEKYIILQKIEKAKELLVYDELSLSEISYRLGYSSVAHLSAQFKKIMGLTPSHFKKLGEKQRRPLDKI